MKKPRWSFVLALLFSALFLAALMFLGGLGGLIFDREPTLHQLSSLAGYAGDVAGLGLLAAAAVVAVRAALRPGSWWHKALGVLPIFGLGLFLFGIMLRVVGIGSLGGFAIGWFTVSAVLAVIVVVAASALVALERASLRLATAALGITGAFSLLAWLGMGAALVMFLLNPATGRGAPPGGGLFPGGPGGGRGVTEQLLIAGGLMTLFGVLAWVTIVRLWRGGRQPAAVSPATEPPVSLSREAGRAMLSLAAVTAVVFVAVQFVPVNKTNAPVVTQVTWDLPQDQALFTGACADCHSNETVRPWYDYIAPSSWLLASHIAAAHARWNISELNKLSAGDKRFLPQQIADALHNNVMPPSDYQMMHPAARLTDAQKEELIAALKDAITR